MIKIACWSSQSARKRIGNIKKGVVVNGDSCMNMSKSKTNMFAIKAKITGPAGPLNNGRKTPEQFESEVKARHPDIQLLSRYKGAVERINCKCGTCGYVWSPYASSLASGYGCPSCADMLPKKIRCIDTGEIFRSINDAEAAKKVHHAALTRCCKGKAKTAGGFRWEYVKGDEPANCEIQKARKTRIDCKQIDFYIEPEYYRQVIEAANADDRTVSLFVRNALKDHINAEKTKIWKNSASSGGTKEKKTATNICMDPDTRTMLLTAAKADGRTISGYVSRAVKEYIRSRTPGSAAHSDKEIILGNGIAVLENRTPGRLKHYCLRMTPELIKKLSQVAAEEKCSVGVLINRALWQCFAVERDFLQNGTTPGKKIKKMRLVFRAEQDLLDRIKSMAEEDGRSFSEYIASVLKKNLTTKI